MLAFARFMVLFKGAYFCYELFRIKTLAADPVSYISSGVPIDLQLVGQLLNRKMIFPATAESYCQKPLLQIDLGFMKHCPDCNTE